MAVHAGNYRQVLIYQCTNPECNFEGAPNHLMEKYESWSDYPTRMLANMTDALKAGLRHEFQWWQPNYKRHEPIRWTPRPRFEDDGTEDFHWEA